MRIRLLNPNDALSFQSLRLRALTEAPTSFASSYEEEVDRSIDVIQNQLATRDDRGIFGALDGERLVGVAGLGRENLRKLSHKAFLWGVYVAPDMRGSGISRRLITKALDFAKSVPGVTQVNLTANAKSTAAIKVYASLGFQEFGLERHSLMVGGDVYDEVHMSLRFAG
ncbi:GNAT family N-acetyltransferase [Paraburkholderia kururiensis]|uniref:GNAT family N-acetyltransferase n=1 Tax=Paraburkholderia kururiensis TaxID=984307 RepID=UPI0005A90573|nr:GNAT family N-acetyltransferase [Paraburkholderia kururiensis]